MKGTFGCVSGDLMCNGLYAFFILPAVKSRRCIFDLAIMHDPLGILIDRFEYFFSPPFISSEITNLRIFFLERKRFNNCARND